MTNPLERFYSAFAAHDAKGMQACYADDATFCDPAFGELNSAEVKAMWEMLLKRAADLEVSSSDVTVNGDEGSANWTAKYTFSATGRKVVNVIHASFILRDGLIVRHRDQFNFHAWAKQSLGFTGFLLGGTNFLKNKINKQARANLQAYMQKQRS